MANQEKIFFLDCYVKKKKKKKVSLFKEYSSPIIYTFKVKENE